jgi:hypothetical protein
MHLRPSRMLCLGLMLAVGCLASLASSAKAADCQTSTDCFNAAQWQRAVANDYSNKAAWFREMSRQNFASAYEWNQKATFAFYAGDGTAATWYKAIADDYSTKAVANAKAADDYANRAKFVNAAADGSFKRGMELRWDVGPSYPEGIQTASAESNGKHNCTSNPKRLSNERSVKAHDGELLFKYRIETYWTFCHGNDLTTGKVTKLYPAETFGSPSNSAGEVGWYLDSKEKIRARCYGGAPERCAWTYQFHWVWDRGGSFPAGHRDTCVTTQVRGDGRHYRHGGCDLKAWSGPQWGGSTD